MSLGELLDGGFVLYRRHFAPLIAVAALCYLPFHALRLYADLSGGWVEHFGLLLVALLIAAIGGLIGAGATLKLISDGYLGRSSAVPDALRFALGRMGSLMVAGFARYILIFLGLMLLFIPGIIVACGYSVVNQVVVLEAPDRATDALSRSWELTRGFRWRAFVLVFILSLVAALPGFAAGLIVTLLPGLTAPALVVGTLIGVILTPLIPCGLTLYYYDLRVRKEAFDLQTLGQLIEAGAPA